MIVVVVVVIGNMKRNVSRVPNHIKMTSIVKCNEYICSGAVNKLPKVNVLKYEIYMYQNI